MKYRNLIFDLDGTLRDSRETIIKNWNQILIPDFLENPLRIEDISPYMGLLAKDVLRDIIPGISENEIENILSKITQNEGKSIRENGGILYENVIESLKKLKESFDLFIVSNAQDGYIEAFLEYFHIQDYFKDFESHGKTGKNKTENIGSLMERNNLTSKETVYIGDTETDYISAKENNLDFIFCEFGFGKLNNTLGIKRISVFSDLLKIGIQY